MRPQLLIAAALTLGAAARADCPWTGTWIQRNGSADFTLSMTAEPLKTGCRLTYRMKGQKIPETIIATVETAFDGKDAVTIAGGKPTGQTMGIRQLDAHHFSAVMKFEGKVTGTVKSVLSPDGKVLTSEVDNTVTSANGPVGKFPQLWDKQ